LGGEEIGCKDWARKRPGEKGDQDESFEGMESVGGGVDGVDGGCVGTGWVGSEEIAVRVEGEPGD